MDDLNDPRISAYKPQRRILLPAPPGPHHHRPSQAERKQEARAEARAVRLHLAGLTGAAAIIMAAVLAAVVIMFVVVLATHL